MDYPFSETSPGVSKQDMRSLAEWIHQTAIDQQNHIESQTSQIDSAIQHFNDRVDNFIDDASSLSRSIEYLRRERLWMWTAIAALSCVIFCLACVIWVNQSV